MRDRASEYPLRLVCRVTGWPRYSLYHDPSERADEAELRSAIERLAGRWPTYGYRRITALLRREGRTVNGKRVGRLMVQMGLSGRAPPRGSGTAGRSDRCRSSAASAAGLAAVRPDQVEVADITSVRLSREFVYLAVIMDVFTRRIRGWNLSRSLGGTLTRAALRRALRSGTPPIHHSDQGAIRHDRLRREAAAVGRGGEHWQRWGSPRRTGTRSV